MQTTAYQRRLDSIKEIIQDRILKESEKSLKNVTKKFEVRIAEIKTAKVKEEVLAKLRQQKEEILQKELPSGFELSCYDGIRVKNHFYGESTNLPSEDLQALRRARELFAIGKKEEAEKELSKLVKKYNIGG
jgi:hypothetical protein